MVGPVFSASATLEEVLAWPDLPDVLRRALSRAVPREIRVRLSLGESVRAWKDAALRAWIVALLAHDVGVGLVDERGSSASDSMIGLLAHEQLGTHALAQFFVPYLEGGQGFGAAFRAPSLEAPATVCAAAFVYRDAKCRLESDFVFLAGATGEPVVQLELGWLEEVAFDEKHIERALRPIAEQVEEEHAEVAQAVVREALLECLSVLDRS